MLTVYSVTLLLALADVRLAVTLVGALLETVPVAVQALRSPRVGVWPKVVKVFQLVLDKLLETLRVLHYANQ